MRNTALLLIVVLMTTGCTAVLLGNGGAATYVWVSGWLEATLDEPLPELEKATLEALEELKLVGVQSAIDGLEGNITAQMASGKKVWIRLRATGFEQTKIGIRVGAIGDKPVSVQILRHIQREL